MNLSNKLEVGLPYQKVIHYKQRVLAMTELFDADLAACFVRYNQTWSVVALEGKLVDDDRRTRLPEHTFQRTLEVGRGLTMAEELGDLAEWGSLDYLVVSRISAMLHEGKLVFVAAKLAKKGFYQEDDIGALARHLAAFEEAGV